MMLPNSEERAYFRALLIIGIAFMLIGASLLSLGIMIGIGMHNVW